MKRNQWILLGVGAVVLVCAVKVYAGNTTMPTYYPVPTGYYDSLKVNKSLVQPCYNADSDHLAKGTLWILDASCPAPPPW